MLDLLTDADVLLVTELSRLSRTMGELLFLLEKLAERNILVVATKDNKSIAETERD
jgi:DNA invertase Pin-like site-specific DNA recombinase